MICSYLFASESLDIRALTQFVGTLRDSRCGTEVWMLYLNSTDDRANAKCVEFLRVFGFDYNPQILATHYKDQDMVRSHKFVMDIVDWV